MFTVTLCGLMTLLLQTQTKQQTTTTAVLDGVSPPTGYAEHGPLRRPQQSHQTAGALSQVDGSHHGGVLHPGRP